MTIDVHIIKANVSTSTINVKVQEKIADVWTDTETLLVETNGQILALVLETNKRFIIEETTTE